MQNKDQMSLKVKLYLLLMEKAEVEKLTQRNKIGTELRMNN